MSNDFQGLILCIRVQFLYKGLSFCMKVSFFVRGSHFSCVGCIFYKGLNFPIWVSFLLCGSHFFFFSLHSSNRGLILLGDQPELSECIMTLLTNCNIKYVKDGL